MRRPSVLAIPALVLLAACASQRPRSWSSTDPYREHANGKLEGRVAWIELADGRRIEGARRVSVDRTEVRWQIDGAERRALLDSVLRIGIEPKQRAGRELAVLLAAIVVSGAAGGGGSAAGELEADASSSSSDPIERFYAPLPGEVVWEAPRRPRQPASGSGRDR